MASKLWAVKAASYLKISVPFRGFGTVPKDLKYLRSCSHEWVKVEGNRATVGFTDHNQEQLGKINRIWTLPEVGDEVTEYEGVGQFYTRLMAPPYEALGDMLDIDYIYAPVSGKVVEVNEELLCDGGGALLNESPYDEGWIMKLEMSNPDELKHLMDADEYTKFCENIDRIEDEEAEGKFDFDH